MKLICLANEMKVAATNLVQLLEKGEFEGVDWEQAHALRKQILVLSEAIDRQTDEEGVLIE